MGYTTQELTVGDRMGIDVVMEEDAREIEEEVVIGYRIVKKRDLTGSVASVTGNDLNAYPATNIM